MTYQIQVNTGETNISLPGQSRLYSAGDVVNLTDEQYGDLSASAKATAITVLSHTGDGGTSGAYVGLASHRPAKPLAEFGPVGTADDHDTLMAALTNANYDPVQLPPGAALTSSPLDLSASAFVVPVYGAGSGSNNQSKIIVAAGATGPALKFGPAAQYHGMVWRDFEVQQNEPTQPCIQLDNVDRFDISNVMARGGSYGWDLGNTASVGGTLRSPKAFNQAQAFFHWAAHVVSLTVFQPEGYLSTGATADCAAGIQHDQGANDIEIFGGHILRAPGIAYKLTKGYYANFAAFAKAWTWLWGLQIDGVSTLVNDDATCAAMWLVNVQQMFARNVWLSAAPSGETVNPIMHIDGVSDSEFTGKFNGRGIVFGTGAVCDNNTFDRPLFDNSATTGMFIVGAAAAAGKTPTNLGVTQPRRASSTNGQGIPLTDNAAALIASLTPSSDLGAGPRDPNAPAIALYDSPGRLYAANGSGFTPTDSTVYASAINLPAGLPITNIAFYSGSTGFTRGTNADSHLWYALVDSSNKIIAVTADDTSAAWAANSKHTLAISGGPYVTKTSGRYWKVMCITKGTGGVPVNPTIAEYAGLANLMNEGTGVGRLSYSATGQAAPLAVGASLSGLASIGQDLYGWVE